MCFQSQASGSLHSLLPNAPENNPTVFSPACWKWPNYCQEEECEAFPGAVCDVRALRRPLRFRQLGYSRSTQTPNSWSQPLPRSNSQTIPKTIPPCEALFFTSGSRVFTIVKWEHQVLTLKNTQLYNLKDFRRATSSKPPIQCLLSSLPCMYCVTRALSNCPQQCILLCRFWASAKRWFRKKNQRWGKKWFHWPI